MGFVVVGIVLVLGLITLAWWLGKAAGQAEARIDAQRQGLTRVLQDPLEYQQSPLTYETSPPEAAGSLPVPPPEPAPAVAEPPPDGDPRVLGFHYFVLAETRPRGAEDIAAFCRGQGLDVAVISRHNTRLAKVIALPGLASARSTEPAYRALDARIEEVGRRWRQSGGRTNFSDKYLQRKVD
jgi:hypothetical protein